MNNINKSDFTLICRICLKKELSLNCLFESEAANMLMSCGFLEVKLNCTTLTVSKLRVVHLRYLKMIVCHKIFALLA